MAGDLAGFDVQHRRLGIVLVGNVEIVSVWVEGERLGVRDVAKPLHQLMAGRIVERDGVVAAARDDQLAVVRREGQATRPIATLEGGDDGVGLVEDEDLAGALVGDEGETGSAACTVPAQIRPAPPPARISKSWGKISNILVVAGAG